MEISLAGAGTNVRKVGQAETESQTIGSGKEAAPDPVLAN